MNRVIHLFLCTFILSLITSASFGSDIKTQQSTLYPYQSSIFLQDDFATGIASTGSLGTLGWNLTGSVVVAASSTGRIGLYQLSTTAVAGTIARINWAANTLIDPAASHRITFIPRLNTNDANTLVHIGAQNSIAVSNPNDGIYFEKLDADTNWFCVTRAGGVQTRNDSGIAVSTSFTTFKYLRNSTGAQFFINNSLVCTQSTNIPTTFLSPILFIVNSAAAAKTIDIDYFEIVVDGLTR